LTPVPVASPLPRLTAAATLRRLGRIAGAPGRLPVDAAPNALAFLEDEARVQGWELNDLLAGVHAGLVTDALAGLLPGFP